MEAEMSSVYPAFSYPSEIYRHLQAQVESALLAKSVYKPCNNLSLSTMVAELFFFFFFNLSLSLLLPQGVPQETHSGNPYGMKSRSSRLK
jgi:hypothetical protein